MTSRGNFCFILSNKLLGFESCREIISNWASKVLEKGLSRAVYKKKEKTETKSILGDLTEMASTERNRLGCMLPCVCSLIAHRVTRYHKAATFTLSWLSHYVPRAKLLVQSWSVLLTFKPVDKILQFDHLNEISSAVISHDSVLQNKIWVIVILCLLSGRKERAPFR